MAITYMLVKTRHGKERIVKKALSKYEQITDMHEIYGQYDLILKIHAADQKEMKDIIHNKIRLTDNIKSTETLIVADLEEHDDVEIEF